MMSGGPFLSARIDATGGLGCDDTTVPWWSVTKAVLATAALRLAGRGAVALDDPVDDRPFTLRQLLQHRAGVPNYGALPAYHQAVRRGEPPWPVAQLLERVKADQLDFEPGRGWAYSNVGYLLVRQLIERVTGQDLGGALRRLVLDDLGLASVRLATTPQDIAGTAWGNAGHYDPGWVYHGLLVGTPADAARFLHHLMTGALLPPRPLAEMTARHPIGGPVPGRPWRTTGYGLGLMIGEMPPAGLAMGHSGVGPGSSGAVYHFGDRATPCTVAAFSRDDREDAAEHEAVRLAGRS